MHVVFMTNEVLRHVIVETPDGNVVVGVNQEIEPPIVQEVPTREVIHTVTEIQVKYNEVTVTVLYVYLYLSIACVIFRTSVVDVINTLCLVCILPIIHSGRIHGRVVLLVYSVICSVATLVSILYFMWLYIGYFFSLTLHLQLTYYWSEIHVIH
jgi:hypothetical protein